MARNVIQSDQSSDLLPEYRLTLFHQIIQEGIRQAKQSANQAYWSFLVAAMMAAASTIVGLGGAGFLLLGSVSEGTVTTAVGLASGMYSYQISKEAADRQKQANDRLAQLLRELQDDKD